ncbi:alpha/beta hydrolase [Roseovarius aestuariivivens]|uniref:alpha/beta hydrolase n=1 Tax=Roseovarius aestuariivivens TaxID=1888910 RepID=UPI001AEBFA7A|nr:alpha/beta hydrolase [Roseovarius aestuariivivens]
MNKFYSRRLPVLFSILFLFTVAASAQTSDPDCAIPVHDGEVLGETFSCGRIDVPENWNAPDGRKISISYVVLKSRNLAPFEDPVVYFQGGPGGSALNSLVQIAGGMQGLRQNRDIIVFDQRGTAHSNELLCPINVRISQPETYEDDLDAVNQRFEAMDIGPGSDPQTVYNIMADTAEVVDYRSCVPYLQAQGIDITQYHTQSTVRDTIALMQHLDYTAYNLFGGSYGSSVALAIMDHYETTGENGLPPLRVAVIDGVAPRNTEFYEMGFLNAYVVLRVFADCEADTDCAASYPEIRQRAVDLLARLEAEPLVRDDGMEVSADDLAGLLLSSISLQKNLIPFLPRLIAELEKGEFAVFDLARAASRAEVILPDAQVQAALPAQEGAIAQANARLESISDKFDAIEEEVSLILGGAAIVREALLKATNRTELFEALLETYLDTAGGSIANLTMTKLEPLLIHRDQRTREGLKNFIQQSVIIPSLQSEMLAIIDLLSDDELAVVFRDLTRDTFLRGRTMVDSITHRIIRCNDISYSFFNDVAFEAYTSYEVPQLIGETVKWVPSYQISCEQLGLAADDYAPAPQGVVSDIPTLIVNGALDTATPPEWGLRAAETLSNATVVTITMSGHVSGIFNACGKALVQSFVLAPQTPLNTSCIDDAKVRFVQPDAPLPQ